MSTPAPVFETFLEGIAPHRRGKVRDIYEVDDFLLIVTTDRISAYDCVLGSAIPDKGKVLTQLSAFWFDRTHRHRGESHGLDRSGDVPDGICYNRYVADCWRVARCSCGARATSPDRVRRSRLSRRVGLARVSGHPVRSAECHCPQGLRQSDRFARTDLHARHQGRQRARHQYQRDRGCGPRRARSRESALRDLTLALYRHGAQHAESCGIIVADTKFEFGLVGTDDDSSGSGRRHHPDRRGAHTRLVSVLAKGQLCAGSKSVQF